jgi:hypothetical protein
MKMADFETTDLVILALAAGFGALGGLVRYLVTKEEALRTIVMGLAAAFAAIFIARPTDWVGLVTGAVAAGYASDAVLAGFVSRTKLATAKAETEAAKQDTKHATEKHDAAEIDLGKAIGVLKSIAGSVPGLESIAGAAPAPTPASLAAQLESAQQQRQRA